MSRFHVAGPSCVICTVYLARSLIVGYWKKKKKSIDEVYVWCFGVQYIMK